MPDLPPSSAGAPALRLVGGGGAPPRRAEPARPGASAPAFASAPTPSLRRPGPHRLVARRVEGSVEFAPATLPPADPRRVFAAHVADALDGGVAAALSPPRRAELMARAATLGLRPFDASLVIAVVQDAARRAEPVTHQDVQGRLAVVPAPAAMVGPFVAPRAPRERAPARDAPVAADTPALDAPARGPSWLLVLGALALGAALALAGALWVLSAP